MGCLLLFKKAAIHCLSSFYQHFRNQGLLALREGHKRRHRLSTSPVGRDSGIPARPRPWATAGPAAGLVALSAGQSEAPFQSSTSKSIVIRAIMIIRAMQIVRAIVITTTMIILARISIRAEIIKVLKKCSPDRAAFRKKCSKSIRMLQKSQKVFARSRGFSQKVLGGFPVSR